MDDLVERQQQEIETLREQVRQLEDLLIPRISVPIEWRLTAAEARVFQHLMSREVATKASIMTALYSDRPDDEIDIKIIGVFVCRIRKKLKPFGVQISTVWGQGYSLDERSKYGKAA